MKPMMSNMAILPLRRTTNGSQRVVVQSDPRDAERGDVRFEKSSSGY